MKNLLISVIVPYYNSAKYFESCLQSIINQTYKKLEIILVDDGSTDESRDIAKKYKGIDNRITILYKKNGGVSSARNYGLEYAHGDIIAFVDSDDSIEVDMYEKMMAEFDADTDIVCCGINRINIQGKKINKISQTANISMSPKEAMEACLKEQYIYFDVYTKLFKIWLFNEKENKIRFPEGRLMEEAAVLPLLFHKSRHIKYIGQAKYNYYIRENSYTTKFLTEECYFIYDTINAYEKKLHLLFDEIESALTLWKIKKCLYLYRTALKQKKHIDKKVFQTIKEYFYTIWARAIAYKGITLKEKIMIFQMRFFPFTVKKISK